MLTVDFIRNNKNKVIDAAKNKNRKVDIEKILTLDDERRNIIQEVQKLREERNVVAKQQPTEEIKQRGKQIKKKLRELESHLTKVELKLEELLSHVPNVPLDEIPIAPDESGNKEIKTWGTIPQFTYPVKTHIDLGTQLDLLDLERGAKVSGFRGYFLKNEAAVLHLALLMYAFKKLAAKGYTPLIAPAIVKGFTLFGTGQFPWGKEDVYELNDSDQYLAGTAETPVTAYHAGEFLAEDELPKRYVAFSPCFRKEAGAYGKDTKGLYRLHEFWKIEQVVIAKDNLEEAQKIHDELQQNSEEVLQELGLPYRVILLSTGEMGEPQIKKYDIETWMPSRNAYGETMSNSIMGDFQARRLKIKYRKKDGSTEVCYTLNNTLVASPRILIAILENFQQPDGSIKIPPVLHPFTGFSEIKKK